MHASRASEKMLHNTSYVFVSAASQAALLVDDLKGSVDEGECITAFGAATIHSLPALMTTCSQHAVKP